MVAKNIIQTFDLTKMYGSVTGIKDVSCSVPAGGVGLLGPNGAGKTTIIRTLLGIIRPTSGTASVLGYDIQHEINQARDLIGYMPEYTDMYVPDSTAMRFVAFIARMAGLSASESKQRASDTLYYVGLEEERYRQLKTFSTGMKQKVKLALALVHDPEVLILDEPTNGLDPNGRVQMLNLISSLQKDEGKNIILSSHLLKDVERTTDNVIVLGQGKVIAQGAMKELTRLQREKINVKVKTGSGKLIKALNEAGHEAFMNKRENHSVIQVKREEGIEDKIFKVAYQEGLEIRYMGSEARDLEDMYVSLFNQGEANE
jgi:ABC-2 type transport system ATP-binding protein